MTLARLKAYQPNGASQGLLPQGQDWEASTVLGDVGALRVNYPRAAARSALLDGPLEIAVEVSADGGTTWTEPYDARYLYLRRSGDPAKRPDVWTAEAPSYVWRLTKARVLPNGLLNADGKRPFLSDNAGTILATLFQEAQARGAMAGLSFDFTGAADSAGAAWAQVVTLYLEPGLDYLALLRNLFDQGLIDWALEGRTIHVWNADSAFARERGQAGVRLLQGRDLTEAPFRGTWEGLANYAYVQGDGSASLELTNNAALAPWGRWETYIAQGGVSDPGTMQVLAQSELDRDAGERAEHTFGLAFSARSPVPLLDYHHGDYVDVGVGVRTGLERMRVRQVTLTRDSSGRLGGNVVLNDRFLEADVRTARRVAGITGGSTLDGGSGARPAPAGSDRIAPAQVTGLATASAAYIDPSGTPKAQVTLSWSAVTTNADGTAISDLATYEIQQRPAGGVWRTLARVDQADHAVTASPYDVGSAWEFQVRAIDQAGNLGAWSATAARTMAADTTPPAVPSTPTATSRLGTVTVAWDGLNNVGAAMDADFHHVEVHQSSVAGFTPDLTTLAGRLTGHGGLTFADQTYAANRYYVLVAVDTSGNKSAPSAQATVTVKAVQGPDLEASSVTTNALAAGSVVASKVALGAIPPSGLQVAPDNLLVNPSFEDDGWRAALPLATGGSAWYYEQSATAARSGAWGAVISTSAVTVQYDNHPLCGGDGFIPCKPGDKFYMRQWVKGVGGPTVAASLNLEARQSDKATVVTYDLRPTGFSPSGPDGTFHLYEGIVTVPAGAFFVRPTLKYLSATADTAAAYWCFDDLELRRVISGSSSGGQAVEISPMGMNLYDQNGDLAISLTSTPPNYLAIADPNSTTGGSLASIADDGTVSGTNLNATDALTFMGYDLVTQEFLNNAPGWVNGYADTLLNALPRGIVAHDWIGIYYTMTSTEVGMVGLDFPAIPNRMYRVSGMLRCKPGAAAVAEYLVRYTTDGSVPKVTSPRNQMHDVHMKDGGWATLPIDGIFRTSPGFLTQNPDGTYQPVRLLLTGRVVGGANGPVIGGSQADGYGVWRVEDIGPYIAETGYANDGGTAAPATKATYTKRWYASWSRSFTSSGGYNSYYGSECVQGYYSSTNGNQKAMIGFADMTGTLAGSTIQSCKFYAYANHWYYNAGGTAVIGTHAQTGAPASFSGTTGRVNQGSWPNPGGKVVSLGTTIGGEFKAGTSRGITLGPGPSTSATYYGKFNGYGMSNPPYVEIAYTK